jgi:hypothetical protein
MDPATVEHVTTTWEQQDEVSGDGNAKMMTDFYAGIFTGNDGLLRILLDRKDEVRVCLCICMCMCM